MFGSISFISLVVFFHQGTMGDDVRHVVGYMNKSIVLHSGANSSWTLQQIHWSIYGNFTTVAIAQNKKMNVNLMPLFQGRLKLNKDTGDLTITNVLFSDALRYRVDLVDRENVQRKTSFVQLSVHEPLCKPIIQLQHRHLDSKSCVISLSCLIKNSTISLSWQPEHGFNESIWSGPRGNSSELVLWTSFTPGLTVTFYCVAAKEGQKESSYMSVNCTEAEKDNDLPGDPHKRTTERVIGGLIGGVYGLVIGGLFGCFIGYILLPRFKQNKGTKNGEDVDKMKQGNGDAELKEF